MKPTIDLTEDRVFRNKKEISSFYKGVLSDGPILSGSAFEREAKRSEKELHSLEVCDRCGIKIKPWEQKAYALCDECDKSLDDLKKPKIKVM